MHGSYGYWLLHASGSLSRLGCQVVARATRTWRWSFTRTWMAPLSVAFNSVTFVTPESFRFQPVYVAQGKRFPLDGRIDCLDLRRCSFILLVPHRKLYIGLASCHRILWKRVITLAIMAILLVTFWGWWIYMTRIQRLLVTNPMFGDKMVSLIESLGL